uniref:Glucuronosyltransferase n=1 Tax=Meloidogyne floridensis TaxID=298350 RepID=A0A915PA18_9BILA
MLFNFILIFLSFISIANGTFKRKLEAIVKEEDLVEEEPLFKKINNSEKDKLTKRALVISTNFDSNNFKMNAIFANLLTKHFYVVSAGNIQEEQIKRQIERESLEIFQKIFCFGRNINRLKNFNLGLFDSNNIGALFVFHAAGIKNVYCVNNTPLKAYQFKYAGKEFPENIPANLGKSKLREILESNLNKKGIDDHKKNEELYETLHEKMDSCKETCKLFNDLRGLEVWNSLREVLRTFKDKFSFLYDCNKDQLINWKINKIGSETFKDIPNIQEELAKGNTKLLISTCNNYQVIEAFAFNVGIICIPYNENQFYIARALNINHPELETIKIGNKSKEYFKNLINRMGTYLKGSSTSSQVSPRRSQTENNKEILNKNILVKIIIYYEEKFDVKKLFRIGLEKILDNDNYMKTVEKAFSYLHEKWKKESPQNVFIDKVLENLE